MSSTNSLPFPDDVIILILARLPFKSLFRFKSVCKTWHRLTSENHFIMLYSTISLTKPVVLLEVMEPPNPTPSFIFVDKYISVSRFPLNFLQDGVTIKASCNGLLCCSTLPNQEVLYVCNPLTKEFRLLPPPVNFTFSYSDTVVGLSFDVSSLRFKVAVIGFSPLFKLKPNEELFCLIFDSGTNSWRRHILQHHDEFTNINRNQAVFANNSLHWLTHSCSYVLMLHLGDNVFCWKIYMPVEIEYDEFSGRIYLLELDDTLSLIRILDLKMKIWILSGYEREDWVQIACVHISPRLGFAESAVPICLSDDVVCLATENHILTYERKKEAWMGIFSVGNNVENPLWRSAYPFRCTLFPFA